MGRRSAQQEEMRDQVNPDQGRNCTHEEYKSPTTLLPRRLRSSPSTGRRGGQGNVVCHRKELILYLSTHFVELLLPALLGPAIIFLGRVKAEPRVEIILGTARQNDCTAYCQHAAVQACHQIEHSTFIVRPIWPFLFDNGCPSPQLSSS